jgi:hypothetical protein
MRRQRASQPRQSSLTSPPASSTARDLSGGLYGGVTDILSQPFRGAKRDGLVGLVRGIGVGVLGVVVKPAVGVVDLATRTTEGLRNMSDDKRRAACACRAPSDGAVLPLSALVGATRAQAVAGATAPATADEQLAALAPHVQQQFQLPATERLHITSARWSTRCSSTAAICICLSGTCAFWDCCASTASAFRCRL